MRRPAAVALVFVLALSLAAQKKDVALPSAAKAAIGQIDQQRIRAHVQFLSDDLLEGRGTGQRGGDIAAAYIASQFQQYGLKPAGDNGTFLQKVPLIGIQTQPDTRVSFAAENGNTTDLKLAGDIVAMDETQQVTSDFEAPVVFVGYGIDAPEYNWDDYKGVDVKGKALLMFVNEPPSKDPNFFKGAALTYYGRWTYKFEQAARKGAVAAILVHRTDMASYGWDVVRSSWGGERSYLRDTQGSGLKMASWIQLEIARQLASAGGQDLDKLFESAVSRDFKPVPLPVTVKAHLVSKTRPFDSANVLAMLVGANQKDGAVVLSAHHDHLGVRADAQGDGIYNGAVDNATGCGMLLEMARVLASSQQKPPRPILFAAVTAEEQGLLGSRWLGEHPPIPAGQISLNLNFDGFAVAGVPEEIEVSGSERTTFYPLVQGTAKQFALEIKPDSNPGAGHYYRSDHFSMARVGVPAFSVNQGLKFKGKAREWGEGQEKEYIAKHYHQPSDQYSASWDFSGLAELSRFGVALAWKAASLPDLVAWQPGDEFEQARKKSQQGQSPTAIARPAESN